MLTIPEHKCLVEADGEFINCTGQLCEVQTSLHRALVRLEMFGRTNYNTTITDLRIQLREYEKDLKAMETTIGSFPFDQIILSEEREK